MSRDLIPFPTEASGVDFGIDEIFFSTTDHRGVIGSGNAVFSRVSGYPLPELLGRPHNLVRHPEMPRVVFRLLWRTLQAGQSIAALVLNRARDGRPYWVVALAAPIADGYLSVRFKPTTALSATLRESYGKLRAIERAAGDGAPGMAASEQALGEALRQWGYPDYTTFMETWFAAEAAQREQLRTHGAPAAPAEGGERLLRLVTENAGRAYREVDGLYRRVAEIAESHASIARRSADVFALTENIRCVALSTTLKSARLGERGRSLGVLTQYLGEASSHTSGELGRLTGHMREVTGELRSVGFHLAAARLQLEMMLFYGGELRASATADALTAAERAASERKIAQLQQSFQFTMAQVTALLARLSPHLRGLLEAATEMERIILRLHVAQVGGRVEANRLGDDTSIQPMLEEIGVQITHVGAELRQLGEAHARFAGLLRAVPEISRGIQDSLARVRDAVRELAAAAAAGKN